MSSSAPPSVDARQARRLKLPPMYTFVRVRLHGHERYCWTGHIYDVSQSGMRFELDEPLEPGTVVDVRALLPGAHHVVINASGQIVRLHDEAGEPGPVRMGLSFDRFDAGEDEQRLCDYMALAQTKAA